MRRFSSLRFVRVLAGSCVAVSISAVLLGALQGCANSILRNAAEAGIETVVEAPLPTPTASAPRSAP